MTHLSEQERDSRQHARVSPSKLKRVLTCPASVILQEKLNIPNPPSSKAAEDGNRTGALAERYINWVFLGDKPENSFDWQGAEQDRIERVQSIANKLKEYLTDIHDLTGSKILEIHQERRVKCFEAGGEVIEGSADIVVNFKDLRTQKWSCMVLDIKDGRYQVDVIQEDGSLNPQLISYLAGNIRDLCEREKQTFDVLGDLFIGILQPRLNHSPLFRIEKEEFLAEIKRYKETLEILPKLETLEIEELQNETKAGECTFCPVKLECVRHRTPFTEPELVHNFLWSGDEAISESMVEILDSSSEIENPNLPLPLEISKTLDVTKLTNEQLELLVIRRSRIENILQQAYLEALKRAEDGVKFEGLKRIAASGKRSVGSELLSQDKLVELLQKYGIECPPKLPTIKSIESRIKSKDILDQVIRPGKSFAKLVPRSSKGEEIGADVKFEVVEEIEE